MSSHHFVKEDQEPALAILTTEALSFERTQELLEWSPTVIVTKQSLPIVLDWKIKIDVVVAPSAQLEEMMATLADQSPIRFVPCKENMDPLEVILRFLIDANYKAVNILIRDEDDFNKFNAFSRIDFEVFYENKRWSWIKSGKYDRWLPAGTQLYFYPETIIPDLQTKSLTEDYITLADGRASIEYSSPFWLGEKLN